MDNILTIVGIGVIQGVASGLILAGVFWLWGLCQKRSERRDQIRYIATLIRYSREKILTLDKYHLPDPPMPKVDSRIRGQIRDTYQKKFRIELSSALSQRCTRLTYDEMEQVREIFLRQHEVQPDTFYPINVKTFLAAESIKWLGLDPMNPDQIPDN